MINGVMSGLRQKTSKTGKTYAEFSVNGQKVLVWSNSLSKINGFNNGDVVTVNGKLTADGSAVSLDSIAKGPGSGSGSEPTPIPASSPKATYSEDRSLRIELQTMYKLAVELGAKTTEEVQAKAQELWRSFDATVKATSAKGDADPT